MIVITGANGRLGHHVIDGLLKKVPAGEIVAAVRNPQKAADLIARGVQVRQADYTKPDTLCSAFAGAEKLLLISSSEVGQRTSQHSAVIVAAKNAGVGLFAYTSLLRADTSSLAIAAEHKATEEAIRASGLKYVLLRNAWYVENHTEQLGVAVQRGAIFGAAGDGRFASASRADYAAAAVAVLTGAGHENTIYELAGDNPFTLKELASEVMRQAGVPVTYNDLTPEKYREVLVGFGLSSAYAAALAASNLGASRGELYSSSRDLHRLIGRPTVTLAEAVALGLKKL